MGTYNIPRNVKGEGRILFIFSRKSLIYSVIGAILGLPLYFIFSALNMNIIGIAFVILLALVGFAIGTFKIPDIKGLKFTRLTSGENIDDIIKRYIQFRKKGKKIYIYTKEEK